MVRVVAMGVLSLVFGGCQQPPPNNGTVTATTPDPTTSVPPTTSTTTFPTNTFTGTQDEQPDHWLHVTEMGQWSMPGGDFTSLTGTLQLMEIVDELDTEEGPDCLVDWTLSGTPPLINNTTCAGCDPVTVVYFEVTLGDPGTCQSPDMPPSPGEAGWRMAWHPTDRTIYRDVGGTGVWTAWWTGTRTGDVIDFDFADSYGLFVDEEM